MYNILIPKLYSACVYTLRLMTLWINPNREPLHTWSFLRTQNIQKSSWTEKNGGLTTVGLFRKNGLAIYCTSDGLGMIPCWELAMDYMLHLDEFNVLVKSRITWILAQVHDIYYNKTRYWYHMLVEYVLQVPTYAYNMEPPS